MAPGCAATCWVGAVTTSPEPRPGWVGVCAGRACSVVAVPMPAGWAGCVAMSTGAGGAPPPPPVGPLEPGGAPSELGGETLLGPSMLPTGPALKPGGWGAPG